MMKLDLKTVGAFLGIVALVGSWTIHFGDFYFSTQYRLETLEESVVQLEKKLRINKKGSKGRRHHNDK